MTRHQHESRTRRRSLAWPVTILAVASIAGSSAVYADPPTYTLQFLGEGFPTSINEDGEVVGWSSSDDRAWYADANGNIVDLPNPPGAISAKANDINDAGLIVGTATLADFMPQAVSWSFVDGAWEATVLETPAVSGGSYGVAVNDLGDIVGTNIGMLGSRAVLFNGPEGPLELYDFGLTTPPVDINNARQVVGGQLILDLDDLSVVDIGVPAPDPQHYLWATAVAINDAGQVVARCVTATGSFYPVAAMYDPVTGWDVLSGPATGNTAADINDPGDVLIFIQSSWGQQPYLLLDGGGAYRVQDLLAPGLELWFIENVGAMAMNDQLQLAVVVEHFPSGPYGAAVLTPLGNPADVDGDGVVGVTDLLLVLAAWGDCVGCPEDIDGDDLVNVADLLILLGSWG